MSLVKLFVNLKLKNHFVIRKFGFYFYIKVYFVLPIAVLATF